MKRIHFLVLVLIVGALASSACGAIAITPNAGSGTAAALPVAFIGIVDSMVGDQWVISGTTVTVAPEVVRDGPFAVGDQVKVEGIVGTDGSFTVTRVEAPTPQDVSTLSPFGNDNTNDANVNDGNANSNDANVNDGNGNSNENGANTNDDNGNDDNSNNANTNDNGTNTNDDNGGNTNDDNSNDDNGGNSNDDNDDDGNSGRGGDDDDNDNDD
ncbi:MAG TPA: DUF5666 domain-containing protein [Anaerolineales bacterium]|nr:DUF5666 domain-containing protein [Anaerolineales bacterium]